MDWTKDSYAMYTFNPQSAIENWVSFKTTAKWIVISYFLVQLQRHYAETKSPIHLSGFSTFITKGWWQISEDQMIAIHLPVFPLYFISKRNHSDACGWLL